MNRTQLIRAVPPAVRQRVPAVRHLLAFPPRRFRSDPWCLAPSVQMHLLPDGDIRACCRNSIALGNIADQRITEIWAGARRAAMQQQLASSCTPAGCENCAAEVEREGRKGSYPEVFDLWTNRLGRDRADAPWPIRMEFNLSNRCNLQCIQCSGDLSSAIRIHREHRPALPRVYDDQFFEDLRLFIPHLRHANFAGGEPFLGPENFRVWDLIAELAPRLDCTINTNATIWNRKVERTLAAGNFSFIFSLDGIHKGTYESIRIDADFDEVMRNVERFLAYTRERRTDVNINHCLMPQNHHEFGDLLLYGEERGIKVNCSVVRAPRSCSIAYLPQDEIRAIHRTLRSQEAALLPRLRLNASTWRAEVARIGAWAEFGPPDEPDLDGSFATDAPTAGVRVRIQSRPATEPQRPPRPRSATVAGLPRQGSGPSSELDAIEELRSASDDGSVHVVSIDAADRVVACTESLTDLLDVTSADIEGCGLDELPGLFARRFGDMEGLTTHGSTDDRLDVTASFDGTEARVALVALRDTTGWADEARILIAFRGR